MYKEHRAWLKKKILHSNIDLEDYEVLESLLSYALPMKNTNIISDNLIRKFGKLHKIFDAPTNVLEEVTGVGKSTAAFIKGVSKLVGFYFESKYIEKEKILSLNNLRKKITLNFVSQTEEVVVVTLLGKNGKLIYSGIVYHGNFNSVDSYIRKIIELIVLYDASSIIISHNHPNGLLLPSADDIRSFKKLNTVLKSMNVDFLDNLIVSDGEYLSFKKSKLME